MPRRVYTYPKGLGFDLMNQIETAGALILGFSFLIFIVNIVKSLRTRAQHPAPADPWNGATLEWSIPSPPQPWNFAEIPIVSGRDELWHLKQQRGGPLPEPPRVSGAGIHMPNPSFWPLVTALGVLVFFLGFMVIGWKLNVAGGLLTAFGAFSWAFEPAG
jgi:cytochrome c oxidase subunit 1